MKSKISKNLESLEAASIVSRKNHYQDLLNMIVQVSRGVSVGGHDEMMVEGAEVLMVMAKSENKSSTHTCSCSMQALSSMPLCWYAYGST